MQLDDIYVPFYVYDYCSYTVFKSSSH